MPTYRRAPAACGQIIERLLEKYHQPLRDAGVTVDCLFALATRDENGDETGPALTLHGYQCAAVVKVVNLKDRTLGRGDAEITIDGDRWDTWDEKEQEALLDHELEHLELKVDRDGNVVRDDLDRPKLRLRKHDHQFGWFDAIARRHSAASFEVQQFRSIVVRRVQAWLPGFETSEADAPEVYEPGSETRAAGGGLANVETADGRMITGSQMVAEIDAAFAPGKAKRKKVDRAKQDELFGIRSGRKAAAGR